MKFLRESAFVQPRRVVEKRKSIVGSHKPFLRDIYKKELLTPHEEMRQVLNASEQNTFFESACETSTNFIIGEGVVFKSDDDYAKKQVEAYWDSLGMELALRDAVNKTIKCGNGYNEKDFYDLKMTGGLLVPSKVYTIPDPSQIYINCDEYGDPLRKKVVSVNLLGERVEEEVENLEEYYIQKVNPAMRIHQADYYDLSYYGGGGMYMGNRIRVYGIPVDQRKITHYKLSFGVSAIYGRSILASSINDHEALFQIERSIATIAKYKAVPRKIWQYGNKDMQATDDELQEFIIYLENLDMEDDILTNKPVATEDLSYSGKDIKLDYAINHLKKKMIAGVSLDFLSGMGQDVNRATAQQELLAFILAIYAKRKMFLKVLQEEYIDPYIKWKKLKEVTIEFAELDFETKAEKENRIRANWQNNMMLFDEMREEMGLPKFDAKRNEDHIGDMLYGELQATSMPDTGGIWGGFGNETPSEAPAEDTTFGDNIETDTFKSKESYVMDPSQTKVIRQKLAVGIRNIYRQRLANILDSVQRNKKVIETNIRMEAGLGINILEEVMRAFHTTGPEVGPLLSGTLGSVWAKANADMSRNLGQQLVGGDIRIAQALNKNAFGFLQKHEEDMRTNLRRVLTDGISQGDSITDISKEIKQSFGKTAAKSELIARTEVIRTYNQSALQTLVANGIKQYKWLTAGDSKVCIAYCRPKANMVYETGRGPLPVVDTHPNCRCGISGLPNE